MLSKKIKELRKKKGLTQEDLANALNVSRQAITKWETGDGNPDIENLKNIALYFHVSVDYLIDNTTEKVMNIKTKFQLIEIFLFVFGICLGIVAKNFEFGFVMCLLMPGILVCVENIVLNKKYEKENNIFAQKELQEKTLPTDLFGRILNTNKEAKTSRIKQYLVNSTLTISVWTIFSSIATLFGKDAFIISADLKIINNITFNNILNYILGFITGLLILFILEYVIYELKVKKYNKIGRVKKS